MKTSDIYKEKAKLYIPNNTSTRGRNMLAEDFPLHAQYGDGAYLIDIDGNRLLDTRGALGTNLLGYGFLEANSTRLQEAFKDSPSHSLTCMEEVELAELMLHKYDFMDMIRFFKTGAEACSAAVRLARASTGKNTIISCGYHGWHDQWATGIEARGRKCIPNLGVVPGVDSYIYEVDYGNIELLKQIAEKVGDLAAIITIPLDWNCESNYEFIKECKKITKNKKCYLIFDEIFSALRIDEQGGKGYFNVEPDLVCLGKAIASGYPLTAVLGKREIMGYATNMLMSSTYATDRISLTASIETFRIIEEKNVLDRINMIGEEFAQKLNKALNGKNEFIGGHKSVPRIKPIIYDNNQVVEFSRFMLKKNILSSGIFFFSYSHSEKEVDYLYKAILEYINITNIVEEIE